MKNILIITKLLVLLNCSLPALEVKWQSNIPKGSSTDLYFYTGIDGSALISDTINRVFYWYDSNGNMQQEIPEPDYFLLDGVTVKNSVLLLPMGNYSGGKVNLLTKIHKKTGEEYSTVVIPGKSPSGEGNLLSSYPYYVSSKDSRITMYVLTEFGDGSSD